MGSLAAITGGRRVLLAVAAPKEAAAVLAAFGMSPPTAEWTLIPLNGRFDMVVTGVGKAAAAGAVAHVVDPARHGLVLSVGIAGSIGRAAKIGDVVVATRCEFADDGVLSSDGFRPLAMSGFGPFPPDNASGVDVPPEVVAALQPLAAVLGPVATVSLCSGTDAAADGLEQRAFAAEAMEGAAVALVAVRLGVPFGELRVVSNNTGERSRQRWDLPAAFGALTAVLGRVAAL